MSFRPRPIFFVGREEAEKICREHPLPSVISISDPDSPKPVVSGGRVLRLRFDDVDRKHPDFVTADESVIRKVVEHFDKVGRGPTLVHCEAGISRSAAVTAIGYYRMMGDELRAMSEMFVSRDFPMRRYVHPNRLLLQLADRHLGSRLVDAAKKLGYYR